MPNAYVYDTHTHYVVPTKPRHSLSWILLEQLSLGPKLRNSGVMTKQSGNTIIDADGISKGFCIDLIAEALQFEGCRAFYVD